MDFNHFLNAHMLDPATGGVRLYREMTEQAVHAEACGYRGVSIPEHHLINILLIPSPLQFAVHVAARTKRVEIVTAIAVLPIRDMRVFAGEVVQASILTDHRLILGVGRGAFRWEIERMGVPFGELKARFEDSLHLLEALLTQDEVAWDSPWYRFDPVTVMPRPERPVPLMVATMAPEGIEAAAKVGYHIQTTPLSSNNAVLKGQVDAFHRGRAQAKPGTGGRLMLQRGLYLAENDAEAREVLERAHAYYDVFENVWSGPGRVAGGRIERLPRAQTIEELKGSLLICGRDEMIDRLSAYAELGIDEVIASSNFGQENARTLAMMSRFTAEVMPAVAAVRRKVA
jgi:alkanesulfonate monooxygenase SsuD/methylene tetrahydromethanopterin reductase-like flavin-dependent oxidoreductase (luciferase family)